MLSNQRLVRNACIITGLSISLVILGCGKEPPPSPQEVAPPAEAEDGSMMPAPLEPSEGTIPTPPPPPSHLTPDQSPSPTPPQSETTPPPPPPIPAPEPTPLPEPQSQSNEAKEQTPKRVLRKPLSYDKNEVTEPAKTPEQAKAKDEMETENAELTAEGVPKPMGEDEAAVESHKDITEMPKTDDSTNKPEEKTNSADSMLSIQEREDAIEKNKQEKPSAEQLITTDKPDTQKNQTGSQDTDSIENTNSLETDEIATQPQSNIQLENKTTIKNDSTAQADIASVKIKAQIKSDDATTAADADNKPENIDAEASQESETEIVPLQKIDDNFTRKTEPTYGPELIKEIEKSENYAGWYKHDAIEGKVKLVWMGAKAFEGVLAFTTNLSMSILDLNNGDLLVYDGTSAWISPSNSGFKRARFHLLTWPYFTAVGFKLSDPGVNLEYIGMKKWKEDQEWPAFKMTFGKNIGDTPDDWYIIYIDPERKIIVGMNYIVTYGTSLEEAEMEVHAIAYERYQHVQGVNIPWHMTFWHWDEEKGIGDKLGELTFNNAKFIKPGKSYFIKPKNSRKDSLPKVKP
ncbi:hypothetical protein JD969_15435 [Planctomycetota bacterium]|nr:hypothetical protein JD969_15435 [Planctomycetota bacterium]